LVSNWRRRDCSAKRRGKSKALRFSDEEDDKGGRLGVPKRCAKSRPYVYPRKDRIGKSKSRRLEKDSGKRRALAGGLKAFDAPRELRLKGGIFMSWTCKKTA